MHVRYHALRTAARSDNTRHCHFDTDSFKIGVDNHALRCMSYNRAHFENFRPSRSNATVGGIADGLAIKGEGTFVFRVEGDNGRTHTIRIPNSLYLPRLPVSLLSPQHWSQEANDNVWKTLPMDASSFGINWTFRKQCHLMRLLTHLFFGLLHPPAAIVL